jgi:hypothetical protein
VNLSPVQRLALVSPLPPDDLRRRLEARTEQRVLVLRLKADPEKPLRGRIRGLRFKVARAKTDPFGDRDAGLAVAVGAIGPAPEGARIDGVIRPPLFLALVPAVAIGGLILALLATRDALRAAAPAVFALIAVLATLLTSTRRESSRLLALLTELGQARPAAPAAPGSGGHARRIGGRAPRNRLVRGG